MATNSACEIEARIREKLNIGIRVGPAVVAEEGLAEEVEA